MDFLDSRSYRDENKIGYYFGKDLEALTEAGKVVKKVRDILVNSALPGKTTSYLNNLALKLLKEEQAQPLFYGYEGFPAYICVSCNEDVVHGLPTKRKLKKGDVLSIDIGVRTEKGYCSDSARTIIVGGVSSKHYTLIEAAEESFNAGFNFVKQGVTLGDVGHEIHKKLLSYRDQDGRSIFGVFNKFSGHGIGHDLHEAPPVYNYGIQGRGLLFKPGMSFCIEPVIMYANSRISKKKDCFTYSTNDNKPSSHYENHIYLTESGPTILS